MMGADRAARLGSATAPLSNLALRNRHVRPAQRTAGYPFIAYGDLDRARKTAAYNVGVLAPYVEEGCEIVTIEPTAAYCLAVSYPKRLPENPRADRVAGSTYELFEFLNRLESESGPSSHALFKGMTFGFHCSCHQRPLGSGDGAIQWLRRRGAGVERMETGTCCGMGAPLA